MTHLNMAAQPRPYVTERARKRMELDRIWAPLLEEVARRHLVAKRDITSPLKAWPVVAARDEFILLAYRTGRFSKAEIGRRLGLHHTSICEAVRRQSDRVRT